MMPNVVNVATFAPLACISLQKWDTLGLLIFYEYLMDS